MRLSRVLAISSALIVPTSAMMAGPVTPSAIYSFGDSLSDNGNAYIASGGVFPGPNYAPGRFTDGPNTTPATNGPQGLWVEQLAGKLGVADPQPYLANPLTNTNYAVASATALPGAGSAVSVPDELLAFGATHLTGAPASGLYTVWAGANDIFNAIGPMESATVGKSAADALAADIASIAQAGGKNFLWLNLPPLGQTPFGLSLPASQAAYLNQQAANFNSEWQADVSVLNQALPGDKVIGVDVNSIFQQVAANTAAGCTVAASNPYCFANITASAQGQAAVNPDTYLYWDDVHPTTEADALIANLAVSDLTSTPEPQAVSMALAGFVFLGGWAVRQRRRSLASIDN